MEKNRKLFLFIAMTLDGYIAHPDGDVSFLPPIEKEGEDYGYSSFIETVDTVIIGRKTYDKVLSMGIEWPYGERTVYVITHSPKERVDNLHFYRGSLPDLIDNLQHHPGKHIYCDGGAETIYQLLADDLVDEMTVTIVPIILGEGISLFRGGVEEIQLTLANVTSYDNGLVKLHYKRNR